MTRDEIITALRCVAVVTAPSAKVGILVAEHAFWIRMNTFPQPLT